MPQVVSQKEALVNLQQRLLEDERDPSTTQAVYSLAKWRIWLQDAVQAKSLVVAWFRQDRQDTSTRSSLLGHTICSSQEDSVGGVGMWSNCSNKPGVSGPPPLGT